MSIGLHIDLEEIDRKLILRLDGRLDAATSPVLERRIDALAADSGSFLLLDCLRLDYLSSAGMRLLLSVSKKLKTNKGALLLFSISEEVKDILKVAGFEKILLIFETEQDALHYSLP